MEKLIYYSHYSWKVNSNVNYLLVIKLLTKQSWLSWFNSLLEIMWLFGGKETCFSHRSSLDHDLFWTFCLTVCAISCTMFNTYMFLGYFYFLISLWHVNSGFFEMHHISATLKTQSLYGFSNEGSNIQIWDTWRALHEATPEIREQNLNLKSLSDQHRTAPVFVNRNEFLNI